MKQSNLFKFMLTAGLLTLLAALFGSAAAQTLVTINFEDPPLGTAARQVIDPYVDPTYGVTFSVDSGAGVVGLVKNSATSACVEPSDASQKLGTVSNTSDSVGLSGFPIRASFDALLTGPVTVSAQFQTGLGVPVRIRLFDANQNEVASVMETTDVAGGTCGFPGDPRSRKTISVTTDSPVAYAVMDLESETGSRVFVIDEFKFGTGPTPEPILECTAPGTGGDRADLRGVRFTVDESFYAIEMNFAASSAGTFDFDAELRRSTGFTGPADYTTLDPVITPLPATSDGLPYKTVRLDFGSVPVSGSETFTLKFVENSAPSFWFFETHGFGNDPCPNVIETNENNVAAPTERGDPAGFKVLGLPTQTINSEYTATPPQIDGAINFNEWNHSNRIPFENGYITVKNDGIRLYLLLNVLDDTIDDGSPADYYYLTFDVDGNNAITPNVDLNYGPSPSTGNMRYQYYLGPNAWTTLQPDTFSSQGRGFGCFFADGSLTFTFPFSITCNQHRVWEFGIDLAEIGAAPGEVVKMGVRVNSTTPDFTDELPAGFTTDFSNLIEVNLADSPVVVAPPPSGASLQFEPDPFEITQAIQDRQNSLPLVADKRTVGRLYIEADGSVSDIPSVVYLYGEVGGVDLPGSPMAVYHNAPVSIDRAVLADTANFQLPSSWDNAATVTFEAKARDFSGNVITSADQDLAFNTRDVPVYWVVPINTGTNTTPVLPSNTEIASQESYLETIFPVSDVRFVRKEWEAIGPTTVGQTINELNDYYDVTGLAWVLSIIFTGEQPFDLPDQIYGFNATGGGISDPVWLGGDGRVSRGFRGSSREGTMAHEINHNLDRSTNGTWGRHVPNGCGATGPDPSWPYLNDDIQEVGFDTRTPWVSGAGTQDTALPRNYPDIMSYCQSDDLAGNPSGQLPTKWISPYRWTQLYNNAFQSTQLRTADLISQIEEVYYLRGQLNVDGSGSLDSLLIQPGLPTVEIKPGDYAIDILDENDTVLESIPFFAIFTDIEGGPLEMVNFNFKIPVQEGATQIVLRLGDKVLDVIAMSDNVPTVELISPNGGESWVESGLIEWKAADADGDELRVSILYSPDGGKMWHPVAGNQTGTSYEVDPSTLPNSDNGLIKLIVSDGFHSAEDQSDEPFAVKAGIASGPTVSILAPAENGIFPSGASILFSGDGSDEEDGPLDEALFIWTVNETPFGQGRNVEAVLPDGEHEIGLTVMDSDGNVATTTITIFVGKPAVETGEISVTVLAEGATEAFTFSLGEAEALTLNANETDTWSKLLPGRYIISEELPADWEVSEIRCDGRPVQSEVELPEMVIDLAAGESVACIFEHAPVTDPPVTNYQLYLPFLRR